MTTTLWQHDPRFDLAGVVLRTIPCLADKRPSDNKFTKGITLDGDGWFVCRNFKRQLLVILQNSVIPDVFQAGVI